VAGVRLGSALSHVPDARRAPAPGPGDGSAILVLATDAPLQHPGLRRLCKRAALGLARCGAVAHHGSGDIAVAFSTADRTRPDANSRGAPELWGNALHDLFQAAVEATEEAVLNSLFGAEDTDGREGRLARALPLEPALAHLRAVRPDLLRAR
jgi:D-aminopeptidase